MRLLFASCRHSILPHSALRSFRSHIRLMSAVSEPGSNGAATKAKAAKGNGKKDFKILMLHGYTQSGPLFRAKTGALTKMLTKALGTPPYNLNPVLIYPTAPHRLRPSDIPGYTPPVPQDAPDDNYADDEEGDNWAWFRRDDATGTYAGFDAGMLRIAEEVQKVGGVDGVLGFSQGAAEAALVAGALEPGRAVPGELAGEESWVARLRRANGGRAARFLVVYSGFMARDEGLAWMYEGGLGTPSLHLLGGLDTVVEEARSRALVDAVVPVEKGGRARVVVHPGGHYVPVNKEWVGVLVGFIREVLKEEAEAEEGKGGEGEGRAAL